MLLVHYFGPEMRGGRLPRTSQNLWWCNANEVFSAHVAHKTPKQLNYLPQGLCKADGGLSK